MAQWGLQAAVNPISESQALNFILTMMGTPGCLALCIFLVASGTQAPNMSCAQSCVAKCLHPPTYGNATHARLNSQRNCSFSKCKTIACLILLDCESHSMRWASRMSQSMLSLQCHAENETVENNPVMQQSIEHPFGSRPDDLPT